MGFKDGQDILTLSLGGADGWTESSSAVVASRLVDRGKVVTIAAGNDVSPTFFFFLLNIKSECGLQSFLGCFRLLVHL